MQFGSIRFLGLKQRHLKEAGRTVSLELNPILVKIEWNSFLFSEIYQEG